MTSATQLTDFKGAVEPAPDNLGVVLSESITQKQLLEALQFIRDAEKKLLWVKADVLLHVREKYGPNIIKTLGITKYEQKLIGTAYMFPHGKRRKDVSFTKHLLCFEGGVKRRSEAYKWIAKATKHKWTDRELKRAIALDLMGAEAALPDFNARGAVNPALDWLLQMGKRLEPFVRYSERIQERVERLQA